MSVSRGQVLSAGFAAAARRGAHWNEATVLAPAYACEQTIDAHMRPPRL
jgi:hypothetical protein